MTRPIKIVSWNMRHRPASWQYLLSELSPDIALLQEATAPPEGISPKSVLFRPIAHETARRKWGNAIYIKEGPVAEIEIDTRHRGSLLVAETAITPELRLCLIDMYGLLEKCPDNPKFRLVNAGTHRMLSDIAFLLMGKTSHKHRNFILCGDMNQDRRMDDPRHGFVRKGQRTTNIFFDRIEDFLLVDCLRQMHPEGIQTFRTPRGTSKVPWQLDYMFVSRSIWAKRQSIHVVNNAACHAHSDHSPIVGEFLLG